MGTGPESCIHIRMPASRHVTWKFHVVISVGPNVITANKLNFKPIFEFSLLEIIGAPCLRWGVG